MTNECKHGHLARSCDTCWLEEEIATLEAEVERLQRLASNNMWQVNYMCSEIGRVFGMSDLTPSDAVQCVRDMMKLTGKQEVNGE